MNSKFLGFVVRYANKPGFKGLDAFLLVEDWHGRRAKWSYGLETGTVFDTEEDARKWLCRYPVVANCPAHERGEVRPVWGVTRRTLSDPTPAAGLRRPEKSLRDVFDPGI